MKGFQTTSTEYSFLLFLLGARLAYNLQWYGVTLLSGSIAASSGMARRAVALTLRPNQLWNNCRLQVLVGGGASWTLPWRALKNRRQPPQSIRPEATQDRRQADTSEPPARTTPHQRTNTPHSDGVSGFALFSHCGSPSVAPHQTGGARLFSLHVKFPLRRKENRCHAAPYNNNNNNNTNNDNNDNNKYNIPHHERMPPESM